MRPVAVAGGDDMLRQGRPRQVEGAVWIGEHPGALRRRDLKSRVAEPLERYCGRGAGRHPHDAILHNFDLMAKTPCSLWHEHPYRGEQPF
jgi:hypothetical protein